MKKIMIIVTLCLMSFSSRSENPELKKVEPPFWWTGMKKGELQLMVYGKEIGNTEVYIDYPGVLLKEVNKVENPNYLFLDLELKKGVLHGIFDIVFKDGKNEIARYKYELKQRRENSAQREGFKSSDVIYLMTPDRFANGDPDIDEVEGMIEGIDKTHITGRHGGDIKGIRQHLEYIADMGFTALWPNPLLENNQLQGSYHGYAITDFYKTDPRFGTNETYRKMCTEAKKLGIKSIMDMVFNHCGSEHYWMKDLPTPDWINFPDEKKITNHRRTVNQDPYASDIDKKMMRDGWFVTAMPDLNQRNPYLAKYLIQNSIWWIEYLGLAGIRMDTYPYPDKHMMAAWTKQLLEEYPHLNIVGEEWSYNPIITSYWQKGKKNTDGYQSYLPSVMDFPLQKAIFEALTEEENWDSGLVKIYEMLANDFVYPDPNNLVTILDNHDMSRFLTQVNEELDILKMGVVYLLTMRGIPQIFYGTEILMSHPGTDEHGIIRSDFPGGWEGDEINAFTGEGLTDEQKEAQQFFKKLLNWRKEKSIIHTGKLKHFAPEKGTYVYFRYSDAMSEAVMVILNKNQRKIELDTQRFAEIIKNYSHACSVLNDEEISDLSKITVSGRSGIILELKH